MDLEWENCVNRTVIRNNVLINGCHLTECNLSSEAQHILWYKWYKSISNLQWNSTLELKIVIVNDPK